MTIWSKISGTALLAGLLAMPIQALAKDGLVSAADPRAAAAGQEILRQGGNAADAAMAMMLALTVVEPQSSGIGGGGFLLYHDAQTGTLGTIDGRETAPAAAKPDRFVGPDGKPLSMRQAVPGGLSVGVPGNLALMAKAHGKWGKLPWKALFTPAIRLADQGYVVTPRLAGALGGMKELWADFPTARAIYWQDGRPKKVGDTVRNPELAAFYRTLATKGSKAFYKGQNAKALSAAVKASQRNPVAITARDLSSYQAKDRPPVCTSYRIYKICGMGPPSSGATTVLQILGMLERFDLKAMGADSPVAWHLISDAMLLAYADREQYLGDADFVKVPVAGLLDPAYVASRSALLSEDKAVGSYEAGTPPGSAPRTASLTADVPGTTHFVAVDGDGDIATMTSTVEGPFGSQLVVNGYFLNNELTDFSFVPEKNGAPVANRVQPGKRPLSSMSPTIVYDAAGKPVFALGAAGGRTIIMQVAKTLIARLDWGMSAQDAIGAPNVFYSGKTVLLEGGTPLAGMVPAFEQRGHEVKVQDMPRLKGNAAALTETGWQGGADPRSEGIVLSE